MSGFPPEDNSRLGATTADVIASIKDAGLVVERFGYWPSFDDAEVLSLSFDRGNLMEVFETDEWDRAIYPSVTAVFYVFDSSAAFDSPSRREFLITIKFEEVECVRLAYFSHQNPILGIRILREHLDDPDQELFSVDWGGTGAHEASFSCTAILVIDVVSQPAIPYERLYSGR